MPGKVSSLLPNFRYHPDPVATGSVKESSAECIVCRRARGFIYVSEPVCPWCIADGSAAVELDITFTWTESGVPDDVPREVLLQIARRTPGFLGWQEQRWLYHCADGCAFLGAVGRRELDDYPDALTVLLHENDPYGWSPEQSRAYVDSLDINGSPSAYLFRCLHCGNHLAYSDSY